MLFKNWRLSIADYTPLFSQCNPRNIRTRSKNIVGMSDIFFIEDCPGCDSILIGRIRFTANTLGSTVLSEFEAVRAQSSRPGCGPAAGWQCCIAPGCLPAQCDRNKKEEQG